MIKHCWKCQYDVEDMLGQETPVCPECGSPLDRLELRTRKQRRRKLARWSAWAAAAGVVFCIIGQYEVGMFGFPSGNTAWAAVAGGLVSFGLALHFLDRRFWPLERMSPLQWAFVAVRTLIELVVAWYMMTAVLIVFIIARVLMS